MFARDKNELVVEIAKDVVIRQIAQPNFRPSKVGKNGNRPVEFFAQKANIIDVLLLGFRLGMSHIEPEHVDAGGD